MFKVLVAIFYLLAFSRARRIGHDTENLLRAVWRFDAQSITQQAAKGTGHC